MPGVPVTFPRQRLASGETAGIADLAFAVMEDYQKDKVAQTQRYQSHPGVRRFLLHAESMSGGPHRTDIRLRETGSAKWIAPFEITPNSRVDVNGRLYSEIRHTEASYIIDEKEDAFTSGDKNRINDHLEQQFNAVQTEQFDLNEAGVWGAPESSSDNLTVTGMRFMLPGCATSTTSSGDFIGYTGRYSSTGTATTIQGMDLSDTLNIRGRRYAGTYDGSVNEGLFDILNRARLSTAFQFVTGLRQTFGSESSAPASTEYTSGGSFLAVPTNQYLDFVAYANRKIANGADGEVNRMFGEIMVDGMLIVHVPYLDNFSDAPMYAINTQELYGRMLTDRMFKWLKPQVIGVEHWKMACVSSFLLHNRNPRKSGFVIHKQFT